MNLFDCWWSQGRVLVSVYTWPGQVALSDPQDGGDLVQSVICSFQEGHR